MPSNNNWLATISLFAPLTLTALLFLSPAAIDRVSANENDPIFQDLAYLFDDKELSKDIYEYLKLIPSTYNAQKRANRIFGGSEDEEKDDLVESSHANHSALDRTFRRRKNKCVKNALNTILKPWRTGGKCRRKCRPCPPAESYCLSCPECDSSCPPCRVPLGCVPPKPGAGCPPNPVCPPCPGVSSNSTTTISSTTTTTSTSQAPLIANASLTSTTRVPFGPKLQRIEDEPTPACKCKTEKPCLHASSSTTTTSAAPSTSTSASTSTSTKPSSPTSTTSAPNTFTAALSGTMQPGGSEPAKGKNFNVTITTITTVEFELEKNLNILCKNATIRDEVQKLLKNIPITIGGEEMKLAAKILSRLGDPAANSILPKAKSSNRMYTYMDARSNSCKIFNSILDAYKRRKCECKPCVPQKKPNCPICNKNLPPCLSNKNKCVSCKVNIKTCPVPANCPSVRPCPDCPKNPEGSLGQGSSDKTTYPADQDGTSQMEDVDSENPVGKDELKQEVSCRESSYLCKFKKNCGAAPLNPLTPSGSQAGYMNGGEDEIYGEWPQHVRISVNMSRINKFEGRCSGVLISDKHVLTAGHCTHLPGSKVLKVKPEEYTIFVADHDLEKQDEFEKQYNVSRICSLRRFIDNHGEGSKYDLAVLTLGESVKQFNDHIQPACLPFEPLPLDGPDKAKCFVVGAGITKYSDIGNHIFSTIVQKMAVERVTCKNWGFKHDDRSRHCFTKPESHGDSCAGDSGGPILCKHNRKWVVAGTVSYGSEKCDGSENTGWVGVYSRVPALLRQLQDDCGL